MTFRLVVEICSGVAAIAAIGIAVINIIRKMLNSDAGIKCLLRSQILQTFNENKRDRRLTYYERINLDYLYEAYKARRGNSFVDDIYEVMRHWDVEMEEGEEEWQQIEKK